MYGLLKVMQQKEAVPGNSGTNQDPMECGVKSATVALASARM